MRPSNRIARYMDGNDYKVYGINPRLGGKVIDEIKCFSSLNEVPERVHIINVFRRSEFVSDLIDEIIEMKLRPDVIWTQIGVIDGEAKNKALRSGFLYVENKCIMVEHQNFF